MARYWGYHLILDCAGCDRYAIRDYDTIYKFAKQLVKDIDMVAYGEPQIVNFGTGDKAVYPLVHLIETSNICAHFTNEDNAIYLDVFSCKPYDSDVDRDQIIEFFMPKQITVNYVERQA